LQKTELVGEINCPYNKKELEATGPFNRLWSAVEPLMDRLSYSVTYPTSTFNHSEEEQEDEEMIRIRRELSAALHDCLPRANEKTDDERYVVL
jgi:hypothetical protein